MERRKTERRQIVNTKVKYFMRLRQSDCYNFKDAYVCFSNELASCDRTIVFGFLKRDYSNNVRIIGQHYDYLVGFLTIST